MTLTSEQIEWGPSVDTDHEGPEIPDRQSNLQAFVTDVTSRYAVLGIYLFGSRGGGAKDARNESDWDILVYVEHGAESLVCDLTLQRHFGEFLDLFAMDHPGHWHYPPWTTVDGMRGWFPESHPELQGDLDCVFDKERTSDRRVRSSRHREVS